MRSTSLIEADKLMYIHNDDTQSYPLCIRLQLDERQRIRKLYYKNLGD